MPAPHDYEAAKEEKARFENEANQASKRLRAMSGGGPMGLKPGALDSCGRCCNGAWAIII